MDKKIKLGKEVQDIITGFRGIATGKAQYITGCDQYLVQPQSESLAGSDKISESHWIDEGRLFLVNGSNDINKADVAADKNGCDKEAPKK